MVWVHNTEASGNHPENSEFYFLETYCSKNGHIIQRATQFIYQGSPVVFTRIYVNDTWSSWGKLEFTIMI